MSGSGKKLGKNVQSSRQSVSNGKYTSNYQDTRPGRTSTTKVSASTLDDWFGDDQAYSKNNALSAERRKTAIEFENAGNIINNSTFQRGVAVDDFSGQKKSQMKASTYAALIATEASFAAGIKDTHVIGDDDWSDEDGTRYITDAERAGQLRRDIQATSGNRAEQMYIDDFRENEEMMALRYAADVKNPRGADRTSWQTIRSKLANKIEENELYYGENKNNNETLRKPYPDFELTTYGITIFMLPEGDIIGRELTEITNSIETRDDIPGGIIIAETAGTDEFYVDGLEFTSIVGGTGQIATQFTFTIRSPFRADLVDYIFKAAATLGIRNHHDIPFFLLLNWRGRDAIDGTARKATDFTSRCFAFRIASTSVLFEDGGSVYEVTAIKAQDHNFNQSSALIQEDMTLEGGTVLEMYEQLLIRLGSRYSKASDTTLMPDAYRIKIPPEMANFELVTPKQDKTNDTSNRAERAATDSKTSPEEASGPDIKIKSNINNANSTALNTLISSKLRNQSAMKRTFTYKQGTPIQTILGSVLNTTKDVQSWVTGLDDPQADDSNHVRPDPADVERYYYKIDPETVYGAYDPNRRKYSVKMIYKITKHLDPGLSVDEETTKQTKGNSAARLEHILDLGLLRKAYPYYYSGLNTEVKNLEYKFDNHWIVAKSLYSKLNGEQQRRHGVLADKFISKGGTDPNYNELRDLWVAQMQTLEANIEKIDKAGLENAPELERAKLAAAKKESMLKQLETIKLQMAQEQVIAEAKAAGLLIVDTESFGTIDRDGVVMQTGSVFFTEVRPKFEHIAYAGDLEVTEPEGVMFPVPFIDTHIPANGHRGTNDDVDRGGNLLAETVAQRAGADMVKIELEIRGDPYWIPDPGAKNSIKPAFQQPYLILLANQAMDYNAGGIMKIDERNGLNAVYNVIKVRNNFAGGEFTQVLECVRDVTIDINAVLAEPDKYVNTVLDTSVTLTGPF